MTSSPTSQDCSAFYSAAVLGLRALDARESTGRRFGADAEARWAQFAGALGAGDRLDILLRDAAGTWGAAFSPSECFGFFGLAAHHTRVGFEGEHISVESFSSAEARVHPWILAGGGARNLPRALEEAAPKKLNSWASEIGFDAITRASQLIEKPFTVFVGSGVEPITVMPYVHGDDVRDWSYEGTTTFLTVPYDRRSWNISASEWFRVHQPEAPKHVSGAPADLYRQRLRLLDNPEHGKQLRLLETPETKRRWSPPDDSKAFSDAVRTWLLERIEASFCEQTTPELRTARQLSLELGRDPAVAAAHELLTEDSGLDLVKLLSDLVDAEGVPFLAGHRYAETGMGGLGPPAAALATEVGVTKALIKRAREPSRSSKPTVWSRS